MTNNLTPNMGLQLPIVNITSGPQWAALLNAIATQIDQHDHSPGRGVPITPAGIDINSILNFNGNTAQGVESVRLVNLAVQPDTNLDVCTFYTWAGELWYNNSAGYLTKITNSGSVNVAVSGTITSSSFAVYATSAGSSSYAGSSSFATTASFGSQATTASYAATASSAAPSFIVGSDPTGPSGLRVGNNITIAGTSSFFGPVSIGSTPYTPEEQFRVMLIESGANQGAPTGVTIGPVGLGNNGTVALLLGPATGSQNALLIRAIAGQQSSLVNIQDANAVTQFVIDPSGSVTGSVGLLISQDIQTNSSVVAAGQVFYHPGSNTGGMVKASGLLFQTASLTTGSANTSTLASYSLPAGTLDVSGQKLRITAFGSVSGSAAQTCIVNMTFGGTNIINQNAYPGFPWRADVIVEYLTSTTQITSGYFYSSGNLSLTQATPAATLTGNIPINFNGSVTMPALLTYYSIDIEHLSS